MATGAEEVENTKRPLILLIPYPAQGHITPMLLLAHSLHSHGLHPILAVPDFIHRRIPSTEIHLLSIPSGLTDTPNPDFFSIDRAMEHHMPPHLDHILRTYSPISCAIVDLLASWAIPITSQANIPTAGFWPAMNATYQLISAIPDLLHRGLISDCGTPLRCLVMQERHVVINTSHLPWMIGSPSSQILRFEFWVRAMKRATSLRWLLTNSFPGEGFAGGEPVIPVRPALNREANRRFADESCLEWLDAQRPGSVVYVAFGTWVGPIGNSKIAELALGLEATRRPFLWVLRDEGGWREGLPEGYLKRVAVEGRGKVVAWAPQEAVLGHAAVGCCVTHCGWNSTMEAVCHGKRMVCYPIAGDQFVNCAYVVREWGVGLLLEEMERECLREVVERVMEGEEGWLVEKRMRVLRERVMGKEGVERAQRKLKLFVDEVKKGVH